MNNVWQAASQEMYNASQQAQSGNQQAGPSSGQTEAGKKSGDQEVTDVDFEEVK